MTMGCQMNKNDSERIAGLLSSYGMQASALPDKADVLIINTCSVRQSAEDRVYGAVKNWQEIKKKNPKKIIIVTGCLPGRDTDGRLRKKFSGADLFFGIESLPRLPQWISELNNDLFSGEIDAACFDAPLPAEDYLNISPIRTSDKQAFVTIQTGCNNFCSYCVVPYARGRERNRPLAEILSEVRQFAQSGGSGITLLGQVVNHYIAPDPENFSSKNSFKTEDDFAALLWELNQIDGLNRIHFTAPDPQYFSQAQIKALALPKQVNYLHLPAQSGDNEILKKMNRKYTREQYVELIKKIRSAKPELAIGTDLIVGFCGENKEQFKNTLSLYQECDFDIAYIAMYSQRSGTAAAKVFKDDVPRAEKKKRWDELQALITKQAFDKNQKYIRQKVEVLVEKCRQGICSGNSREMKYVEFLGAPEQIGKIVDVEIFNALEWVLKGK